MSHRNILFLLRKLHRNQYNLCRFQVRYTPHRSNLDFPNKEAYIRNIYYRHKFDLRRNTPRGEEDRSKLFLLDTN